MKKKHRTSISSFHEDIDQIDVEQPTYIKKNDETDFKPSTGVDPRTQYKYRLYTFILISLIQIFVNYDMGAVPVMLNWIQKPYKFNSTELGVMGSLPYIGYVIISPFLSHILSNYSNKKSLIFLLSLNVVSLLVFGLAVNKWMFFISKFCIGATQALFFTYYPLWIDSFAPQLHRNLWMSIIQGGIVVGMTIGYIVTSVFTYVGERGWRYSMLTQVTCEAFLTFLIITIPKSIINLDHCSKEKRKVYQCTCDRLGKSSDLGDKIVLPVISDRQESFTINPNTRLLRSDSDRGSKCEVLSTQSYDDNQNEPFPFNSEYEVNSEMGVIHPDRPECDITQKESNIGEPIVYFKNLAVSNVEYSLKRYQYLETVKVKSSSSEPYNEKLTRISSNVSSIILKQSSKCDKCLMESLKMSQESAEINKLSFWSKLKLLMKQSVFMFNCISISMMYFEVFGIHYWMTKIGVSHLKLNEKVVHLIFSMEAILGPILGIVSGSYLIDQIIFHYPQYPLIVDFTLIIWASIACGAGVVLIVFQNAMTFAVCIFVILFYGSSLVPTLTLSSIAYLPYYLKPIGASFFITQYNIFGYMLGTLVPGIAVDVFHNYTSALIIIFVSGFIGMGTYIIILLIKWERIKRQKRSL